MANEPSKFLQICFMGDEEDQVNIRCQYNQIEQIQERTIVSTLHTFLEEKNKLIQLFKRLSGRLEDDNYVIVIKADNFPVGQQARRFNAPTFNEVGIVMVGDAFEQRGQSMQMCGLELENQCFSHGQLYVACSRVGKPKDLFVYAKNGETKNIVHDLALQ